MFWLSVSSCISVLGCPQLASVFPFWVDIFQPRCLHKGDLKGKSLRTLSGRFRVKSNISTINILFFFSFKNTKQSSNF